MKRSQFIAAGIALVGAALATVFAAGREDADSAKCYPTADGKYVCKATGEIMDKPCCDTPDTSCCKK